MLVTSNQLELGIMDDVALVSSAKLGNLAAFELLIQRHTGRIFRVAMHFTRSREDAEDIVQETFLKAYQYLQRFEERARFSTWLASIAANEALMRIRRSRRVQFLSMESDSHERKSFEEKIADSGPDPEQACSGAQLSALLQQGVASLPEAYKSVFLLRDVEGLSTADTAERLGVCVPNVKTRLFRARRKLRHHLRQYLDTSNDGGWNHFAWSHAASGARVPGHLYLQ